MFLLACAVRMSYTKTVYQLYRLFVAKLWDRKLIVNSIMTPSCERRPFGSQFCSKLLPEFVEDCGRVLLRRLVPTQKTNTQCHRQWSNKKKFSVPWIFHILSARWLLLVLPEEEVVTYLKVYRGISKELRDITACNLRRCRQCLCCNTIANSTNNT